MFSFQGSERLVFGGWTAFVRAGMPGCGDDEKPWRNPNDKWQWPRCLGRLGKGGARKNKNYETNPIVNIFKQLMINVLTAFLTVKNKAIYT